MLFEHAFYSKTVVTELPVIVVGHIFVDADGALLRCFHDVQDLWIESKRSVL